MGRHSSAPCATGKPGPACPSSLSRRTRERGPEFRRTQPLVCGCRRALRSQRFLWPPAPRRSCCFSSRRPREDHARNGNNGSLWVIPNPSGSHPQSSCHAEPDRLREDDRGRGKQAYGRVADLRPSGFGTFQSGRPAFYSRKLQETPSRASLDVNSGRWSPGSPSAPGLPRWPRPRETRCRCRGGQ